jgi:hypothetical protein
MTDPLDVIWPCVDLESPRFAPAEVEEWPATFAERLIEAGLLVRADTASHVVCPNCGGQHIEEIVPRSGADGRTRFFIRCAEALRVEVPAASTSLWTIDFDALAGAIAGSMSLKGRCKPIERSRLWQLGRYAWKGATRDIVFARGLLWPDGRRTAERVGGYGRTIVLVAEVVPPVEFWPSVPAPTVALTGVAALSLSGMEIDLAFVAASVERIDACIRAVQPVALTKQEQTRLFRQQARTVLQSHLNDDELVGAYLEHGSYRDAAAALSKQKGVKVSKDAVARAVRRRGGPQQVRDDHNSCSVRRTVASQTRDRKKKYAAPPQHPETQ